MRATTLKWGALVLGSAAVGYVVSKTLYERYERQIVDKIELGKLLATIFRANVKSRLTGIPAGVLLAQSNPEFAEAAGLELGLVDLGPGRFVGIGQDGFAGNADDTQELMPLTEDFLKWLDELAANGPVIPRFDPLTGWGYDPKGEAKP